MQNLPVGETEPAKKESRTDELFFMIGKEIERMEKRLEKVLKTESPKAKEAQSETTNVNRTLALLNSKLRTLVNRIDL